MQEWLEQRRPEFMTKVWTWHCNGFSPSQIADKLHIPEDFVYDTVLYYWKHGTGARKREAMDIIWRKHCEGTPPSKIARHLELPLAFVYDAIRTYWKMDKHMEGIK